MFIGTLFLNDVKIFVFIGILFSNDVEIFAFICIFFKTCFLAPFSSFGVTIKCLVGNKRRFDGKNKEKYKLN